MLGAAVAAVLAAVAFGAGGGQDLSSATWTEVFLTTGGAAFGVLALLSRRVTTRLWGGPALWLFAALAAWSVLSVTWSVYPEDTWVESARTVAYLAVFAGGLCLARLAPRSGGALLGGIAVAASLVAGYALLTKVLPGQLAADEIYSRLRAPFGYWNAVGVAAALGVPATLWLGARREGRPALAALAYPATGVLLIATLLAYSRGALLALGLGLALWFLCAPLRLRGALVLLVSGLGAAAAAAWAFGQSALTDDRVALPERASAGHALGLWLAVTVLALLVAGVLCSFALTRGPFTPRRRRRAGIGLLAGLAIAVLGFTVYESTRPGGLAHRISAGVSHLTDTRARIPPNQPSRLAATGSVRARYWSEAGTVWSHHRLLGVGAGGFATARQRYSRDEQRVRHAHGFLPQTLADLGLVGLALTLALFVAWGRAALRAAPLRARRTTAAPSERAVTMSLLSVVVVVGVHSVVDWTWFIPGCIVPALLAAGWLAGRGPLSEPSSAPAGPDPDRAPLRLAAALALLAGLLVAGWAALGPLRSQNATDTALRRLIAGDLRGAVAATERARALDPLSPQPFYLLSAVEDAAGHPLLARSALARAVRLAPSSPDPWLRLATFEETRLRDPRAAEAAYSATLALDPHSKAAIAGFLRVRSETGS